MNQTTFVGNLTRDPELITSQNGSVRAVLSIAVNEGERGTANERTHFIDVAVFNGQKHKFAENVAASFKKGQRVIVVARFSQNQQEWIKNDGSGKVVNLTFTGFIASAIGHDLMFATTQATPVSSGNQGQSGFNPGDQGPTVGGAPAQQQAPVQQQGYQQAPAQQPVPAGAPAGGDFGGGAANPW